MASREVFADTSALYALLDRNDRGHAAARAAVGRLIRSHRPIVATDYIIAATVNLANARGGALVGLRVLDLFEQSASIRVEWIGPERFATAKTFFRKQADHGYSFTVCTSFVVMQELRVTEALTTDRVPSVAAVALNWRTLRGDGDRSRARTAFQESGPPGPGLTAIVQECLTI